MDEIKDIEQSVFSKLLDPALQTNPFGINRSGERAYRRAERIVAGIILLTNHILGEDDLRRLSRNIALSLLTQILDLKDEMRSLSSGKMRDLQVSIRHLISLVKMMVFSGFVSFQNAEVVTAALEELNTFVTVSARSALSESLQLSKEDFMDTHGPYKGQAKDIKDRVRIRDNVSIKDMSVISGTPPRQSGNATVLNQKSEGILSVLKAGGEQSLPDVAAHLPEYGEKTIQRELALLVERGIVKRTGLKRWSRYSLVAR